MPGRTWQNSSFLDRVLIPLLASAMRAAWVVPVANALAATFLFSPRGVRVPFLLPVAVLYVGSTATHFASESRGGRVAVALAGIVAAVVTVALLLPVPTGLAASAYYWQHLRSWSDGVPAALGLFVLAAGLWLRAVTADWGDFDSLRRGLIVGAVALALVALAAPSSGLGLGGGVVEAMVAFVLSALAALAFSDVSRTLRQSERSGGAGAALGRYWFGTVALVIVVVVAAAWLVGALLAPDTIAGLWHLVSPALAFVWNAFAYLFMGAAYLIFLVFGPLFDWFRSQTRPFSELAPEAMATKEPNSPELYGKGHTVVVSVPPWLQVTIVVLVLAFVAFLIYRAVRRRRRSSADGVVETREVDWDWGQMRDQLRHLFGRRRDRQPHYLPLADDGDPRAVVRRLYRQLLTLAEGRGLPRGRGQTPWAYGAYLSRAMPELSEPLMDLTRAYVQARYAPLPPTPDTVAAATTALRLIQERMAQSPAPA
jgi:hypothetical protein